MPEHFGASDPSARRKKASFALLPGSPFYSSSSQVEYRTGLFNQLQTTGVLKSLVCFSPPHLVAIFFTEINLIVCCASELLRLDNFLLQPTVDNVLACAGLSAVLRDQANPGASWSLLGR